MSRIGKEPVLLPVGVKVEVDGTQIKVTGPKGYIKRTIRPEINIHLHPEKITCEPKGKDKRIMAFWGLTRTLLYNMVMGVERGFEKKLNIEGIGYRATVSGNKLTLNVGYSSQVNFDLPSGITAVIDKDNSITLQGVDKELIGLTAARIRAIRRPEPYKGKGIRYDGEYIARKVGKAGGKK